MEAVTFFEGKMDEVSIWTTPLTPSFLRNIMHTAISSTTGLEVYHNFYGGNGQTQFTDQSGNGHTGTWYGSNGGINTFSVVETPTYPFMTNTAQNVRGLWSSVGTAKTIRSNGLRINATTTLSDTDNTVWGNNGAGSSVVTNNLPTSVSERFLQFWTIEESGTVDNTTFEFDLGSISQTSISAGAASSYVLLYRRSSVSGTFAIVTTGSTTSNNDRVQFTNVNIEPGYYTIGTTDTLSSPLSNSSSNTSARMISTNEIDSARTRFGN